MPNLNITNIPAPRVPFVDERTGLMAREWYRFFLNLFVLTGSGNNPITLEELQIGPPNQPDLAELLIQINQNIAPQYEDQSGDFLATLDTAQLMSMMSRFENAEAAIQGAYLQPVVQTGTIANYNLDGSPTAGGIAYGTGPALAVSAAGTLGQVLTSAGAGAPTWTTPTTGTVTAVSVVSANGLAGTVATATTTPAITLSTTITGLLKGNGTAISAATSGTDYAPATSGTSILYGNGSGGFSNVTIGTGVAFAGGTLSATGSGGTVTSVTGTAPVVSSGGATPAISMAAATTSVNGYLTSTDWNTFNGKGSGSVTSVAQSFTGGLISVAGSPITTSGTLALTVAGTSGGIPYFSSASTWATSAALSAGALVQGGGAGVAPSTITTGTGVVTALGVNTGTAGAFVVNGGALGTPSSGTVTNLTGTASININGTVGATTAATVQATTIAGTDTTDASSTTAAALKTAGGLAVVKKIYVGDNVVIATSGKGIDFSATSSGSGTMTSELLSDYEEGTFTPDQGSGLTVVGAFTSSGAYTRVGRLVTVIGVVAGASTISCTANGTISTNLPFAAGVSLNAVGVAFTGSANYVVYGTATVNQIRSNLAIAAVSTGISFTMSYMTT
jgi:trimeric autotransporter adhesin